MALKDRLATMWKGKATIEDVVDALEAEIVNLETEIDTAIGEKSIITAGDAGLVEILSLLRPHLPAVLAAAVDTIADTESTRLLAYAIASANRSFGSADDIVAAFAAAFPATGTPTFPESVAEWNTSYGLPVRVDSTADSQVTIQIPHSPAPLDNATFRTEMTKILCRAAGPGIDCVINTADLGVLASAPDHAYSWQEASAPVVDQIGTENFTVTDTAPSFQQTPGEAGRFYTRFDNVGEYMTAAIPAIAVNSQGSFWARLRVPAGLADNVILQCDQATNDWQLRINTFGHLILRVNDDVGDKNATIAVDHQNQWFNLVVRIDNTTSALQYIATDLGSSFAFIGTTTSPLGAAPEFQVRPMATGQIVDISYLAYWERMLELGEQDVLLGVTP